MIGEPLFYPDGLNITAIDFLKDLLHQAKKKYRNSTIQFLEMDFESKPFDWVIGSLVLSVVPHPSSCFGK